MPNAIVYAHSDYGGIHLRTLAVEKGLLQLQPLLTSLRSDGIEHKLALIALSWAQFLAGTNEPIFENVKLSLPHLAPMKWIPAIRDFLASINGTLEMSINFVPELQRENDCFLMTQAGLLSFSPTQMLLLNACRLYLGVTFLSDITNAQGTEIRIEILQGKVPKFDSHRGLIPYQNVPSQKAWRLWRRLIHTFTLDKTSFLTTDLGRWFVTGDNTFRKWRYYEYETAVYIRKENKFEQYVYATNK